MNVFKATLDTRHQNGVIGTVTQFDNATLELQVVTDGVIDEAWGNPRFELIAMKRDANEVREVDQDRFTILSKEDHKVQIELKEQFLSCRGTVKMQLVVKDGSRESTTLFYLVIGQSLDHDIVESHRDVKVLDDLEAYVKQGFDDLAYQEQRMVAVEQSTNDLNETMNANEEERNAAEAKRSKTFETNEANRTQMFNNQVEEQGVAFSNAQAQREKDFSESQQNMSQAFETSQRERDSAFNKAQELNQTTFTNNETKRQTAFNQSQTANQQDFVDNEAERQRLFESNESDRQKSESQRVKNESERVFAETQRAEAEVTRQQKMTEFEEKATQLSDDLDNQVARVDEFVTANEEKLLGPHDKTDYMGNAHKSVKDVNDANVEYILGEVNTVHYEGQHITATDTIEKQVRSAILKGNTLVNLAPSDYKIDWTLESTVWKSTFLYRNSETQAGKIKVISPMKPDTRYLIICNIVENDATGEIPLISADTSCVFTKVHKVPVGTKGIYKFIMTTKNDLTGTASVIRAQSGGVGGTGNSKFIVDSFMVIEYQQGMENWDIPYFEGMQSVKLPVLKATGKNTFNIKNKGAFRSGWYSIPLESPFNGEVYVKGDNSLPSDFRVNILAINKNEHTLTNDSVKGGHTGYYQNLTDIEFHCPSLSIEGDSRGSLDDLIANGYIVIELGGEPYKSNILSCQLAPLNQTMFEQGTFAESTPPNTQPYEGIKLGSEHLYTTRIRTKGTYKVVKGATYSGQLNNGYGIFICYCKNGLYSAKDKGWIDETNFTFTVPNDCDEMFFAIRKTDDTAITPSDYPLIGLKIHQEVVLRSLPNGVKDTLNLMTGEYVQRIGEIVLDGTQSMSADSNGVFVQVNDVKRLTNYTDSITCDKLPVLPTYGHLANVENGISAYTNANGYLGQNWLYVRVNNSINKDEIKQWLSQNPITVQYQLATESTKTVDLSGQKVYSYDRTTHYSCSAAEGALVPTLSIDVPTNLPALVSRQRTTIESQKEQIITLEEENEQLIAQNEVQDIDISLNQDAINFMLFAPATMSVNDESKNSKGANTMAAYLANQILKGKLDYALVVGRYGSYKEDIDTILIAEGKQDLIK